MNSNRRTWLTLGLLLAARLAVGLTYSFIVPPWESFDETGHYQYARYLAKYRQLLQPGDPEADQIWSKFQPPLYYLLIAPVLLTRDLGQTFLFPELNPLMSYGNAGVNFAVTPDSPTGLERAQVEALRAARALGAIISTLSVIFVFLSARLMWPAHSARIWAATLLYAFWPQFVFIGSMVTNDLLVTSLAAPILYCVLRILQAGSRYRLLLATALLLVAALLTKLNALAYVPVAVSALLFNLLLGHRAKSALTLLGLTLATCLGLYALSSLDFVTGQVFQWATLGRFLTALQTGVHPVTAGSGEYALRTFFASYGWGNLETHPWVYPVWYGAAAIALVGLGRAALTWRSHRASTLAQYGVLLLQPAALVGLATALAIAQQDNLLLVGRYLLPALPCGVLLLVAGWVELCPPRWQRSVLVVLALSLVVLSWLMPFTIIADSYAKPLPISSAQSAVMVRDAGAMYGDEIELLGYLSPTPTRAGQRARVDLCWQARRPVTNNYYLQLELIGPDGQGYGKLVSYPRDGNFPTSFWAPGQPFCDWFELIVPEAFPAPAIGIVEVSFLRTPTGDALPVTVGNGTPQPHGARVPLVVRSQQPPPQPHYSSALRLGDSIELIGYDVSVWPNGRGVRLDLHWTTRRPLEESYRVFAHLRSSDPQNYTQSDGVPRHGSYPTNVWAPGEVVVDSRDLELPRGTGLSALKLYVGLYRPADGSRLPITDGPGQLLPNGEVVLAFSSPR
jgi:hypothetical protein